MTEAVLNQGVNALIIGLSGKQLEIALLVNAMNCKKVLSFSDR
jgi:hypothetical protein